jgi:peptide/nickel transport system permease protein
MLATVVASSRNPVRDSAVVEASTSLQTSAQGIGRDRISVWRQIVRDRASLLGAVLVAVSLLAATVGPVVTPHDPIAINAQSRLSAPNAQFWLGTDELGRDLFSRMIHGSRISLTVGLGSATLAALIGISIGMLAGFRRGWIDAVLMRLMDVLFAFPAILLALLLVALLGSDLRNLVLALTVVYIPAFARITRGSTLAVAAEPFVEAARSMGASDFRILRLHVAPNIVAPVMVQFTVTLAYAILVEASLSFLGLGVQPPTPSWGNMLNTGKPLLEVSPWPALVPGMALFITVLGFNLVGDGLRDALDPRLRVGARAEART